MERIGSKYCPVHNGSKGVSFAVYENGMGRLSVRTRGGACFPFKSMWMEDFSLFSAIVLMMGKKECQNHGDDG